ncbi:MAG: asparagine synthetase B, partial [Flavobacterium sp.]
MKKNFLYIFIVLLSFQAKASFILLPMDETTQQNHLKAYGITYWCLSKDYKAS